MKFLLVLCILYPSLILGQPSSVPADTQNSSQTQSTIRSAPSVPSTRDTIKVVQHFLRESEKTPNLEITGTWTPETQADLASFVLHLQKQAIWNVPWEGPQDGNFTAAYGDYLRKAIKAGRALGADHDQIAGLQSFTSAMNRLRENGTYSPDTRPASVGAEDLKSSDTASSSETGSTLHDYILGPFLWFANGALSGFGDEIYCAAFHKPDTFSQCHDDARVQLDAFAEKFHGVAIVLNLVGSAVNVFSLMLSLIAIETEWSGLAVLFLSFFAGVVDFVLYTLGDFWTWGWDSLDFGQIIVMSALSGFVMAWVVAIHRWKFKKPPIRLQIGGHGLLSRLL